MTQRVPSTGYYDNIIEDHSYTMFSMYPATTNAVDWQLMKEENCMVRECWLSLARAIRTGHKTRGVILLPALRREKERRWSVISARSNSHYIRNYVGTPLSECPFSGFAYKMIRRVTTNCESYRATGANQLPDITGVRRPDRGDTRARRETPMKSSLVSSVPLLVPVDADGAFTDPLVPRLPTTLHGRGLWRLVSLDGLHSGVPTRTTPTLTPTTLRSIEQTFLELTSESASHSREAGFVPPLVEPSQPTPAQTQNTTAVHLPAPTTTLIETQQQTQPQQQQQPVRRNMGGRRPTRTIGMTPEEEQRRQIRRERNKMAAARCRKRRMDHTNALLEETEGLEKKKQNLQDEIEQLKQVKDELEFILDAHRAVCRRSLRPSSPLDIKPVIKTDLSVEDQFAAESVKGDTTVAAARPNRPNSLPVGLDNNNRLNSLTMFVEPKERPDTLAFKTVETPSFMKSSMDVAGMPITTPTSGIPFNFESLMEGGTGLTPVSTPLIPSCSTQQRSNLSAVDLSSPDANPPKLVSL
ncbi:Transcription factor kayak [Trachymyrmex zeteki]|uniref:Transcription factor kayak n=1 Tax=Mycetomoellerius zeteki TaxID=64791 RepID=A0A151WQA7_9HYME|nr:Transcription factor kayak [Trachymyrmex zeteki]